MWDYDHENFHFGFGNSPENRFSYQKSRDRQFDIELFDDTDIEGDETFTITLEFAFEDERSKAQFPKGVSTYSQTVTIVGRRIHINFQLPIQR